MYQTYFPSTKFPKCTWKYRFMSYSERILRILCRISRGKFMPAGEVRKMIFPMACKWSGNAHATTNSVINQIGYVGMLDGDVGHRRLIAIFTEAFPDKPWSWAYENSKDYEMFLRCMGMFLTGETNHGFYKFNKPSKELTQEERDLLRPCIFSAILNIKNIDISKGFPTYLELCERFERFLSTFVAVCKTHRKFNLEETLYGKK